MRKIAGYLTKNRSGRNQKIAQSTHENGYIKPRKTFWRNSKQLLRIICIIYVFACIFPTIFCFSQKVLLSLPESKTKGCPCRAEIIPYEPDTVSTGEGIVSSENTLYIPPSPERCLFGLLLIIFILYLYREPL